MNVVHEGSPAEPYSQPGSLLWNQMLTQLAPRYFKSLIGVHMRIDVEILVLADVGWIVCMKARPLNLTLNLGARSETRCWHNLRQEILNV